MKFKNLFKITKTNLRKKMWSNLKYQINSIRNLLNEFGVLKAFNNSNNNSQAQFITTTSACQFKHTVKLDVNNNNIFVDNNNNNKPLKLITAYAGISKHLTKPILKKGVIGDDAWFIESKNSIDVLGIADGVGGWQEIGVDPSKFSSNLMKQCNLQSKTIDPTKLTIDLNTPVKILSDSYKNLIDRHDHDLVGSSTACILLFNQSNSYLYSANLGDSGFVVIRDNQIVHRSNEQQHYFNCPFQLAILPGNEDANLLMQGINIYNNIKEIINF